MNEIQLITNKLDWKCEKMVESYWKRAKKMTTFAKKTWKLTPSEKE
jgi:hypothetical protein